MKVYWYEKCGTCRKALKYLDGKGINYELINIREYPPTIEELQAMLSVKGDIRKLFNTSGRDYKEMKMKDKLPQLSDAEALRLLNNNGNLVKRPFVIGDSVALVGFKEEEWDEVFSQP